MAWADYHHYEDLANAATYTPTAKSIATLFNEEGTLQSDRVRLQFWGAATWNEAFAATPIESSRLVCQDNDQNVRIANDAGGARKISLTGVTWS